jgi:hypothetical protein
MQTYGGVEVQVHALSTCALDSCKCSITPGRFNPEKVPNGTGRTGDRMGPRTGLGREAIIKIFCTFLGIEARSSGPLSVTTLTADKLQTAQANLYAPKA